MPYQNPSIIHSPIVKKLLVITLISLFLLEGCYSYRVMAPHFDPSTEYHRETAHSLFWGLVQTKDIPATDCDRTNGLDEVHVINNFGYSFLTVATLGFWSPVQIEWRCSKPCKKAGEI